MQRSPRFCDLDSRRNALKNRERGRLPAQRSSLRPPRPAARSLLRDLDGINPHTHRKVGLVQHGSSEMLATFWALEPLICSRSVTGSSTAQAQRREIPNKPLHSMQQPGL